jgi:serine/threonine protein kinase
LQRQYTIIEALGSGGMGTVYLARREGPVGFSKQVAIKLASRRMAESEALMILADEARALGVIRHRAIVKTDGLVRLGGMWALVMEYVEGVNLQVLGETGRIPLRAALMTVSEVAGALHAAQLSQSPGDGGATGLIHRDIKPANLLLTPYGDVKILDFGISLSAMNGHGARSIDTNEGSAEYLAPERFTGVEGPKADIYGLGAVLYEVLVGEPFGRTVAQPSAHGSRLNQAADSLAATEAAACVGLRDFILAMLAYDPSHRPTAREVERHCETWATQAPGIGLRDYAELAVPSLIDQERHRVSVTEGPLLPEGTVLVEESAPNTGPLVQTWTPRTPSSGGMGLVEQAEPATSPIEILRALLAQQEPETVRRVPRTYGPDTEALDTERWLEDSTMLGYLAWFAGITLLIALGLVVFVVAQMMGGMP